MLNKKTTYLKKTLRNLKGILKAAPLLTDISSLDKRTKIYKVISETKRRLVYLVR
jgi:hypothetical protein